jgi:hypothetical protein
MVCKFNSLPVTTGNKIAFLYRCGNTGLFLIFMAAFGNGVGSVARRLADLGCWQ